MQSLKQMVSTRTIEGRRSILKNLEKILAVELMTACQALEFRGAEKTSPVLYQFYSDFRKHVAFIEEDVLMHDEMEKAISFLQEY